MSINFNKFVPRPGLVNKQGCLPDPSELVAIEVPKIFDQCLIKRCLVFSPGPDAATTDCELRSDPLDNPRRYIGSRDFGIRLLSVEKTPLRGNTNYKRIQLNYRISFYSDYIDCNGVNQSEFYEINRTDTIGKFYCPDTIAEITTYNMDTGEEKDMNSGLIKLELVAEALDGDITEEEDGTDFLDITLGYFLVVKSELMIPMLVPAYEYNPVPQEPAEEDPTPNPCERFFNTPMPRFNPSDNLQPLFPGNGDYDEDDED